MIIHKEVGYLCPPTLGDFAHHMIKFLEDENVSREMGEMGRNHIIECFSTDSIRAQLNKIG